MKLDPSKLAIAINLIHGITTDPEFSARATEIAAAKAIAYGCPLPSSPVENIRVHYALTCKAYVEEAASALTERMTFNVRNVLALVEQMYNARYIVCHVPRKVSSHRLLDSVVSAAESKTLAGPYRSIFEQLNCTDSVTDASDMLFRALNGEE